MPSKNTLKEYEPGGYYHLYNRGVNKRLIFKDQKDYSTFLSYLQFYLSPPPVLRGDSSQDRLPIAPSKVLKNYYGEIELLAYCLMPNHFHLMVKQTTEYGINHFMRSLCTKYAHYFNARYNRVGHLFQDTYNAVRIKIEYHLPTLLNTPTATPSPSPPLNQPARRLLAGWPITNILPMATISIFSSKTGSPPPIS
jgi:putative transposase